jgi:hypothetical protein
MKNLINKFQDRNYFIIFLTFQFIVENLTYSYLYFSPLGIEIFVIIFTGIIFLFYKLIIQLIKDRHKSGLIFISVFFPFANYGIIHNILFSDTQLSNFITKPNLFLLILLPMVSATLIYLIAKSKSSLQRFTGFCNLFFLLTAGLVTNNFISNFELDAIDNVMPQRPEYSYLDKQKIMANKKNDRDIYFLVFDSYTGFESLDYFWQYKNNELRQTLQNYNFKVFDRGRGNYNYTTLSIASTLNMGYFDSNMVQNKIMKVLPLSLLLIKNNYVTKLLTSSGYNFINISPFDIDNKEKYYNPGFFGNEPKNIYNYFLDKTALGVFYNRIVIEKMNEINLAALDDLDKAIFDTVHPKFIYAHIMMPHDPFFFDRNGNITPESARKGPEAKRNKKNYLEQLMFANKKIEHAIYEIFSRKNIDPIVIIQGDHGYRFLDKKSGGSKESHSILFAVHAPEIDSTINSDEITGVNAFRTIFNNCFGFTFPILKHDESFVPIVED